MQVSFYSPGHISDPPVIDPGGDQLIGGFGNTAQSVCGGFGGKMPDRRAGTEEENRPAVALNQHLQLLRSIIHSSFHHRLFMFLINYALSPYEIY